MEALWATILFSGFALEVIIRHQKSFGSAAVRRKTRDRLPYLLIFALFHETDPI